MPLQPAGPAVGDRSVLGPADVGDETLAGLVAQALGVDEVELLDCRAEVAAYDLEALTTAGRYWVRGSARHAGGVSSYAFFVKVVQSWTRSAAFQHVPEPVREIAAASLPWRNEPEVYRSDLRDRLPAGLSMPRAHAVLDLDELSAALWLDAVDHDPRPWDGATFRRAAHLLGRLAASPDVRPLRGLGSRDVVRGYAASRLEHQVLPVLRADDLWHHPLVEPAFDADLRNRLLRAADALPGVLAELDGAPLGTAHGDACPRNLLRPPGETGRFVLIDFGLWCEAPLGFDLTQLLLGEVQTGERPAAELAELDQVCLQEYHRGLAEEGHEVDIEVLRRCHALLMLMWFGLTAVPLEVLFGLPAPGGAAVVQERARAAATVLDLVDSTVPL
ncbi:phosphotransferase [Auraticoccus sp. F435]|uniref:Phosphotransferase n=1 Tax=Auraticoccus cholistanensis TaxID=2656650 RepID=A0A6A9UXA2_9ACTN|nr:phosphotransferase [Auraticoccus cholistanensis]MVA76262.1 phosphotransferase [Auraticoccus cholistanensis]